jgi:hypothetical protein
MGVVDIMANKCFTCKYYMVMERKCSAFNPPLNLSNRRIITCAFYEKKEPVKRLEV